MGYDDWCTYSGTFLPLFDDDIGGKEHKLPTWFRIFLYLAGLAWTFLGIGAVSDIFMEAIEKVTSKKKRVTGKDGKTRTVLLWNATVANLTLMALGSSAPEILLSMIEILLNNMLLGDLGAGTIVGSAAFNLLIISAVCVCAIPDGETRHIKEVPVYVATSSCSVFAYIWLLFIMQISSPDVCDVWEAGLTLIFMPMLIVVAYLADRGYFSRTKAESYEAQEDGKLEMPADMGKEELAEIERSIRAKFGENLSTDEIVAKMQELYFHQRSRAYYRHKGWQAMHGHKEKIADVQPATDTSDAVAEEKVKKTEMKICFASDRYSVVESMLQVQVYIRREAPNLEYLPKASVAYETQEGTAKKGEDYTDMKGVLEFDKDEVEKHITIPIVNDDRHEDNEDFYVTLKDPKLLEEVPNCEAKLGAIRECTIVIIDDDPQQKVKFEEETVTVHEKNDKTYVAVNVQRIGGHHGIVSVNYRCDSMGAVDGFDFEAAKGTLQLQDRETSRSIQVAILPSKRVGKAAFNLVLEEVTGAAFDDTTDGGAESCVCHVQIMPRKDKMRTSLFNRMQSRVASANMIVGRRNWGQQFSDALFKVVDDDEDEDADEDAEPASPTPLDWFFHIACMPWKLLFAFIPPTDFCGGWACFYGALAMIAVVTAIVGDMAGLVGSCLGIHPEITAITFVALGTSLPDTFASMAAAQMDPYADASIGNVTGSNSVNVFLGIGISWLMGACWWSFTTADGSLAGTHFSYFGTTQGGGDEDGWSMQDYYWHAIPQYPCDVVKNIGRAIGSPNDANPSLIFVTPAGTMGLNLACFSLNAFCAIWHLFARRKKFGGELGGPRKAQHVSAVFLGFQWCLYITVSCIIVLLKDMSQADDLEKNGYKGCGPNAMQHFVDGQNDR